MAKFCVESGPVRVMFHAVDATEAAVRAFQLSSDKQPGIEAESPSQPRDVRRQQSDPFAPPRSLTRSR